MGIWTIEKGASSELGGKQKEGDVCSERKRKTAANSLSKMRSDH